MRDQSNRHSFIQVVKIWIPDCGYRRNFSVALSAAKKWDRRRCRKPREHAQFKRVTPNTTDARATTRAQRGDRANTLPHPNANDILRASTRIDEHGRNDGTSRSNYYTGYCVIKRAAMTSTPGQPRPQRGHAINDNSNDEQQLQGVHRQAPPVPVGSEPTAKI